MKSRMERYYRDSDDLQRTSRNSTLYDELYKEKQEPTSNVTVIDNVNEIDIEKIKDMVNNREEYRKVRNYENIMNHQEQKVEKEIEYEFEEIDDSKYDINQIIEKKKVDRNDDQDKVRKITNISYVITESNDDDDEMDNSFLVQDKNIKDLVDTITDNNEATDLFANLKENKTEEKTITTETSFYTNTVIENKDFDDDDEKDVEKTGTSTFLKVLIILSFLIAIGVFVWFKFFA